MSSASPVPPPGLPPLRLTAVTAHPRHAFVTQLVVAVNAHGSVLDSHPFSNLALAVDFEVSSLRLAAFSAALLALPMSLSDPSLKALAQLGEVPLPALPEVITGSLNITFTHAEPDLHMHIPAVPG